MLQASRIQEQDATPDEVREQEAEEAGMSELSEAETVKIYEDTGVFLAGYGVNPNLIPAIVARTKIAKIVMDLLIVKKP